MNTGSSRLFDSVPPDYFQFGRGTSFKPKQVSDVLRLKKVDVSHIASVAESSVRYDDAIPEQVLSHLTEIANTLNLVAKAFEGDISKAVTWFTTCNPMLGDITPRDMIRLGKYDRLRKYIVHAMMDQDSQSQRCHEH
jgi:hypothetical protein